MLKISYFGYSRVDEQGRSFSLCNHPEFTRHYYENKYENADIIHTDESQIGNYILWDNLELRGTSDILKQTGIEFGIDHTFTLIEKNSLGNHYYCFSTHVKDRSFNQEYFRHLDLLKNFILYFNEQITSSKSLRDSFSERFAIYTDETACFDNKKLQEQAAREEFLQQINSSATGKSISTPAFLTKYLITLRYQSVLSEREIDCLFHTLLGKTAKLTGVELGISRRTVEEHIASIKNKINVNSKAALFEKVINEMNN